MYFSSPSDPAFVIHCVKTYSPAGCAVEGMSIRIPAAARPAGGPDHHLSVIDQTTGTQYDFYGTGCDSNQNFQPDSTGRALPV